MSWAPAAAILVSLIAAVLIILSRRHPNLREAWTLIAAVAKLALVISILPSILSGGIIELRILRIASGLDLSLRVDPLGIIFALVASSLWLLTSFYSIGYMRGSGEKKMTRYFASFAVCLSATMGIAFAGNILTFLLFYEILTIATYPLVIHKETEEAIAAGRKYLVYTLSAGLCFLVAAGWTYHLTGTLDFKSGGFLNSVLESGAASPRQLLFLFGLFIAGAGVKAGLMPLHAWLPSAMVAPTPVSALLHAVAVVKAGVFAVVRIVGFVFGPTLLKEIGAWQILAWISGLTLIIASLIAMGQDNLKRRLAYSTIGHLSYIVLGAALLSPASWTGALLHIVNHATMKITLFFCAGAIYVQTHKTQISQLNGIGRQMPITMAAFTIGALGLAGIPPINGFASKWYLAKGTLEADQAVFLVMLLLSGVMNAAYFFPIVHA
ncbi:MAG: monovalent cation/H+ antiporter subunit D family protein, partial [Candidatus Eisenbacteria bacterium]|nr:monovalent cation/H+ antiporter subunit D family protein [Candidatus Eisenbacteria bacterium]